MCLNEIFSKGTLDYTIRKVLENQERVKLNSAYQLLDCAADAEFLSQYITTVTSTETSLGIRLIQNYRQYNKNKIYLLSHHQNAEQN
jgi:hypothetical protein